MSKRNFLVDIDLNKNQLLNAVVHNLASAPTTTSSGQTYYNTVDHTVYTYAPSNPNSIGGWLDLGSTGITNLGYVPETRTVTSSTGTDAVITLADVTNSGLLTNTDWSWIQLQSGTNTGDQTSIVGITGTEAQFNTSLTDGSFMFVGDAPTAHTHLLAQGATDVTATAGELNILDLSATALTAGWGYFADGVSTASWRQLSGSEINNTESWTNNLGTVTTFTVSSTDLSVTNGTISTSGTITLDILADAVTNAKLANMNANTVKLNATAGSTNPTDFALNINSVLGRVAGNIQNIVIDSDLATVSTSDDTVASAKAIKSYVDSSVAGQLVYQGGYNASTNTPNLETPVGGAVNKGFTYTVTADGDFFTEAVQVGDVLIAEIDDPSVVGDWTVVNKNIPTIVTGDLTEATSSVLTIVGGTDAVFGTGTSIEMAQASTSVSGYLSSTDWNTFNSKSDTVGTVTSVGLSVPTGLTIGGSPITTAGTLALTFTAGYSIPTTVKQGQWDTAYTNRITSLTTTGTSGAATLISNTLNIPNYENTNQLTTFTLTADTGTLQTIAHGNTLDIAGGTVISTVVGATDTVTVNHDNVTRSDATSSASPAHGATFDVVDSVTSTAQGHITAINVKTVTLPTVPAAVASKYAANLVGASTTYTFTAGTHGLGTSGDFTVQVKEVSSGEYIDCEVITNNSTGLVTLNFNVAPTTNQYRVIIIG